MTVTTSNIASSPPIQMNFLFFIVLSSLIFDWNRIQPEPILSNVCQGPVKSSWGKYVDFLRDEWSNRRERRRSATDDREVCPWQAISCYEEIASLGLGTPLRGTRP